MKIRTFFFITALFAGVSVAGMKNVAVVETEIDAQSGASTKMTSADVRLVTTELRREAVKNLPRNRYNIMTSETVYAQGSAVLEECAEENCVIALGSKIGADYIVRGIVSRIQTMFTLSVEIYETENGNLVASSDPVRSESVLELLEKAAVACASMYRTFANEQHTTSSTPISALKSEPAKATVESKPAAKLSAKTDPVPTSPKSQTTGTINVPGEAKTISEAMKLANTGYYTIHVAAGVYNERIIMVPNVVLVSTSPFGAKIDGGGRGTVITMAANTSVKGFEVRNGTIGIFSKDIGNEIRLCRVINNRMTGIMAKRHLPKIEDNIVAFNGASGIQAWDIHPTTSATVNHNTIAYNDNHGITIGGSSEFVIEHNVIAFNEWQNLKILHEPEKIQVSKNNFYGNLFQQDNFLTGNNYAFDPAFLKPLAELNFSPDTNKCCKEKGANGENLGARLNY
jgi:hypothetical protein